MKTYKVSVLGDLMCEPPLFEGAKKRNGKFDFWPTFKPLKKLMDEADYVIGNLETPVAGEKLGYTQCMVSFNAPDEYLDALKKLGVDMVSTANNHSYDRGMEGLINTIDACERYGIAHTGTYKDPYTKEHNGYFTLPDGTKIAVIASTYGTNDDLNSMNITDEVRLACNYHRERYGEKKPGTNNPATPELKATKALFKELAGRDLTWDEVVMLKKAMGIPIPYPNDRFFPEVIDKGVKNVYERDVKEAKKEKADLIFAIPHSGGQFNVLPGKESIYTMKKLMNLPIDAVFMGHSHTSQKAEVIKGCPYFYSLGNVTMAPNSIYPEPSTLPEFGIIPHLYIAEGKIVKTTFSLYEIKMDEKNHMTVWPVDELYDALATPYEKKHLATRVAEVLERITELPQKVEKPKREYKL